MMVRSKDQFDLDDEVTVLDANGKPLAIRKIKFVAPIFVRLDNGDEYKRNGGNSLHGAPGRIVLADDDDREELAENKKAT